MSALICGSFAYDTIMVFHDRFKNHILPEQVHILSVSFLVPELRREFGGCAGNIAYNLNMLGGKALPMGTVGKDFTPYREWMLSCGVGVKHVREIADTYTAQAFITTDLDDNQITAFHPGAMNHAHENSVTDVKDVRVGIIAPDGREGMIQHAAQFHEAGIPFVFDPGQGLPMFDGADLMKFLEQATWAAFNDYEFQLVRQRTGKSIDELMHTVQALIVTHGAKGSTIYTENKTLSIPVAKVNRLADPTGCGDAYRAGLLYGLMNDLDWEMTGRIAALMGAIKIEQHGTQNHRFEKAEFEARFKESFGYAL
ncbi:MAG TPA: carbohydrate kinase family protein [Gammaproteobacteria bacterium]|nr:carbohydrate kinase family protein [Gammaproteobacteria bacterium]